MKTKHTQKKWMIAITGITTTGKDKYQVVADIPHEGAMGHSEETPICDIIQFNSNEEAKANAKLISLSPVMLKLLIEATEMGIISENDGMYSDCMKIIDELTK